MYQRVRANNIDGTLGGTGLPAAASFDTSTITASILTLVPALKANEILPLIINADRAETGEPEIVWLLGARSAGGSTGSVLRGMEGTTPVAWAAGTTVFAGPTKTDFIDHDYIDARLLGVIADGTADNSTALATALGLASVGASWALLPSPNFDNPLKVRLSPGTTRYATGLIIARSAAGDGPGLIGSGAGNCILEDTRTATSTSWTITTVNASETITVTSGTPASTDVGHPISGAGIPANTYIIAVAGSIVTLSAKATASASGVAASVKRIFSLKVLGDDQNNRVDGLLLEGITMLRGGTSGGHDHHIGILERFVGKSIHRDLVLWDYGVPVLQQNVYDTTFEALCRAQYGGTTDGEWASYNLMACGLDTTDTDKVDFLHATAENFYGGGWLFMGAEGKATNKCGLSGACKAESGNAAGPAVRIVTAHAITIDDQFDLSIGDLYAGADPVDGIVVRGSEGVDIGNVNYEQRAGIAAVSLRDCVRLEGGNTHVRVGAGRLNNGGGNPAIDGYAIRYTEDYGENLKINDDAWPDWSYDGAAAEPGVYGHPNSRVRGSLRQKTIDLEQAPLPVLPRGFRTISTSAVLASPDGDHAGYLVDATTGDLTLVLPAVPLTQRMWWSTTERTPDGVTGGDRQLNRGLLSGEKIAELTTSDGTTGDHSHGYGYWWPRLSPRGDLVIVARYPLNGTTAGNVYTEHELVTIRPDGTGETLRVGQPGTSSPVTLPATWTAYGHAEWDPSANGRIVVFAVTAAGSALVKCEVDGSLPVAVAVDTGGNGIVDPSFSPDATKIVFVCDDGIYTVPNQTSYPETANTVVGDWTLLRALASDVGALRNYDPYYNPAGTRIAWLQQTGALSFAIKVMDANGTNVSTLVGDGNLNSMPVWSADGDWIYFHRYVFVGEGNKRWGIWKIAADGTGSPIEVLAPDDRDLEFPYLEPTPIPAGWATLTLVRTDSSDHQVAVASASGTVDGETALLLDVGESVQLVTSDGTDWWPTAHAGLGPLVDIL